MFIACEPIVDTLSTVNIFFKDISRTASQAMYHDGPYKHATNTLRTRHMRITQFS